MEKTPDSLVDELLDSFDNKVCGAAEADNASAADSMAESVKKHKHHDKSKKHKKPKKKSKKSKKRKHHSSRSSSPDDRIELKLKKNKLEEAKSGMPVTLDAVMDTIVTTANEKSERVDDDSDKCHRNGSRKKKLTLTDESEGYTPEKELCDTGLKNGKIVIKDLKESRLYHELINEIEEKERLKTDKHEDTEVSCSSIDVDKKRKKEKPKSKKKKRSRSRNRSNTPKRHKKRKRSRSPSTRDKHSKYDSVKSRQSNSRNQNGSNSKSRHKDASSRSKDKARHSKRSVTPDKRSKICTRRSRLRESTKSKRSADRDKIKNKSRSRENSINRTRHRSRSSEKIDKKKLFKIARKNALSLVQQGVLPAGSVKKNALTTANLPTKTVDELTDFCRKLSKKEKDHDDDTSISSDDEEFKQPFHHPFLVKDRPNIVMNIRNATQLPTKSFQEKTIGQDILRQQFPVSSGQTHSLALNEWVPLGPEESAKLNKISRPDDSNKLAIKSHGSRIVSVEPVDKSTSSSINTVVPLDFKHTSPIRDSSALATPYAHGSYSLLSYETGQFTGHTGAKILTPAELSAGYQPWVKKDHLKNTAPVNSGIGIHLLQKMGWKPGEGLGKNHSGSLEPLLLDVKMDKRGLITEEEIVQGNRLKKLPKKVAPPMLSLDGKHPVSLLNEFCAKRKWDVPKFNTLDEAGPSHRKTFIMTVVVNGTQYCSSRCQTKKLAKMEAAKTCLREIGLLK